MNPERALSKAGSQEGTSTILVNTVVRHKRMAAIHEGLTVFLPSIGIRVNHFKEDEMAARVSVELKRGGHGGGGGTHPQRRHWTANHLLIRMPVHTILLKNTPTYHTP